MAAMETLPVTVKIDLGAFTPEKFDSLAKNNFCFFLDSGGNSKTDGRYSFFGLDPVRTFSSSGGFVTVNGHTVIDNPIEALKRFEAYARELPFDPYLPFSGGLVGFVSHSWAGSAAYSAELLPDAWFGLFDTVITYDHLEEACWVSSLGIDGTGTPDVDTAKMKIDAVLEMIDLKPKADFCKYIIKPLTPDPVSDFSKDSYVNAVEAARKALRKKEWQRANIARRFYAPIATSAWNAHKMFRLKNSSPYSSFLRCGTFEISSTSPACFLKTAGRSLSCNVVQSTIQRLTDQDADDQNVKSVLARSRRVDPAVLDDETSLKNVLDGRPSIVPVSVESDKRTHYLTNRINGKTAKKATSIDCLLAAMPGASMTGVPKMDVNKWIDRTEPSRRAVYTGAVGCINTNGDAQFNTAVRTMLVKDQVAYVHTGWQVSEKTEAEEAFVTSQTNMNNLFEEIRGLGF